MKLKCQRCGTEKASIFIKSAKIAVASQSIEATLKTLCGNCLGEVIKEMRNEAS